MKASHITSRSSISRWSYCADDFTYELPSPYVADLEGSPILWRWQGTAMDSQPLWEPRHDHELRLAGTAPTERSYRDILAAMRACETANAEIRGELMKETP